MTAIVSLFGFVARFAGDLLNTATGWAGTLMFGRVPQSSPPLPDRDARRFGPVGRARHRVPGAGHPPVEPADDAPSVVHHQLVARLRHHARCRPRAPRRRIGRLDGAGRREPRHRPAGRARACPRVPARPGHRRAARVPRRGRLRPEGPERAAPLVRHAHPDRRSAEGLRRHGRHHPRGARGCRVPPGASAGVAAAQPARLGAHPPRRAERPASSARIA